MDINFKIKKKKNKLLIMVAHHKQDDFLEISRKYFFPIHVGKENSNVNLYIKGDNEGNNISKKNKNFCELTAYYYAWKNLKEEYDYIGLMHYRRLFSYKVHYFLQLNNYLKYFVKSILSCFNLYSCLNINNFKLINMSFFKRKKDIEKMVKYFYEQILKEIKNNSYDIYLPKKIKFKNLNLKQQFVLTHNNDDWDLFKRILIEKYPFLERYVFLAENLKEFYAFNMFIMKRNIFDEYMEMMFNILFEMEKKVNLEIKDEYQERVFGFISERFLNIYILFKLANNSNIKIKELEVVFLNDI